MLSHSFSLPKSLHLSVVSLPLYLPSLSLHSCHVHLKCTLLLYYTTCNNTTLLSLNGDQHYRSQASSRRYLAGNQYSDQLVSALLLTLHHHNQGWNRRTHMHSHTPEGDRELSFPMLMQQTATQFETGWTNVGLCCTFILLVTRASTMMRLSLRFLVSPNWRDVDKVSPFS